MELVSEPLRGAFGVRDLQAQSASRSSETGPRAESWSKKEVDPFLNGERWDAHIVVLEL